MKVFLTGGTGFLGEYLLAELLKGGHEVWALHRREKKRESALAFLRTIGVNGSERLHWIKGDICEVGDYWESWCRANLGLEEVDTILHGAASLRFERNASGEPFRTNVDGARTLRNLVDRKSVSTHIISTAFVCGFVEGKIVYEVNHPRGNFVNVYEQSKWEAEQIWVEKATVLRPSIIVGDSLTGRTTSFNGWYAVVKACYLLDQFLTLTPAFDRLNLRINVPADPMSIAHLIPVDYVAKAVIRIIEAPENHHRIFHLTPTNPSTYQWSYDVIAQRFRIGRLRFSGRSKGIQDPPPFITRQIWNQIRVMLPYFSNNPIFDRRNTDMVLPDLEVPVISEFLINKLIDYAIEVDWRHPARKSMSLNKSPLEGAQGASNATSLQVGEKSPAE